MDVIQDVLEAIFVLGLPVATLSWFLIRRLRLKGHISADSTVGEKREHLTKLKSDWKADAPESPGFLEQRWMKFGGGFYGITATTTFFMIEAGELWQFLLNLPGTDGLFKGGLIDFIVGVIINQIQNFISAFIWFGYWVDDGDFLLVWLLVPYGAYLLGLAAAEKSLREMQTQLRVLFSSTPPGDPAVEPEIVAERAAKKTEDKD